MQTRILFSKTALKLENTQYLSKFHSLKNQRPSLQEMDKFSLLVDWTGRIKSQENATKLLTMLSRKFIL
jgi:hypothetical protein